MNKYEKKINKAITAYENAEENPKHSPGWIYRNLDKGYAKGKISLKHLGEFCERFMAALLEDEYGRIF